MPKKNKTPKHYQTEENPPPPIFRDNKSFWEIGPIEKRIENMIYIIKGPQLTHKRQTKLKKPPSEDADIASPEEKEAMDIIYDIFDMPIPQAPRNNI